MSKVFVLLYYNAYDGTDFHGVYSTKEKAEERIKQFVGSCREHFDIDEVEVDEELR